MLTNPEPYPDLDGTQSCNGQPPELWFPGSGPTSANPSTGTGLAIATCRRCPFRRPCLAYALTVDVHGIWGGKTHEERKQIRAEHRITAVSIAYSMSRHDRPSTIEGATT